MINDLYDIYPVLTEYLAKSELNLSENFDTLRGVLPKIL